MQLGRHLEGLGRLAGIGLRGAVLLGGPAPGADKAARHRVASPDANKPITAEGGNVLFTEARGSSALCNWARRKDFRELVHRSAPETRRARFP